MSIRFQTSRSITAPARGFAILIAAVLFFQDSYALPLTPDRLAVVLPATGDWSYAAKLIRMGLEMALDGQPRGMRERLELRFYNSWGIRDSAAAIAAELANDPRVTAWMGGYPSDCAAELARVARRTGIPYIIISASADSLTRERSPNIFRIAPPARDYNEGLLSWAAYVVGDEQRMAVLLESGATWSAAYADLMRDFGERWVGDVRTLEYQPGELDFTLQLASLERDKPRALWLLGETVDLARFLRRCRETRWIPNALILGATSLANSRMVSLSEGAAEYALAPAVWWDAPRDRLRSDFISGFGKRYGEKPDYHAAEAHAALNVLCDALERAEGRDAESLNLALAETDLQTVFGRVRFQDYRDYYNQNRVPTAALQMRGVEWVSVWPEEIAQSRHLYPIPDWRERAVKPQSSRERLLLTLLMVVLCGVLLVMAYRRRRELLKDLERRR